MKLHEALKKEGKKMSKRSLKIYNGDKAEEDKVIRNERAPCKRQSNNNVCTKTWLSEGLKHMRTKTLIKHETK
jgi:hypothetical protein